jgi:benzylsuccinate CoA-transferase BbsE subunit
MGQAEARREVAVSAAFRGKRAPEAMTVMTTNGSSGADALDAPLAGVRVLVVEAPFGLYAAKLLASLGADVLLVEPPGGMAARRLPPFYKDEPGSARSLPFWFLATSCRSVTCNLATADGRALFRRLLPTAQVVLAGAPPERLLGEDAGFGVLREEQPALVWASVSGFGDWGPHAEWLSADLIGVAMSGIMTLAGYPDRPPIRPPGDQGVIAAGIDAAQGILMALRVAERTGEGQQVEVSMQEALSMAQETAMQTWDMQRSNRKRVGEVRSLPGLGTYRSADGWVYSMVGVPGFGAPWPVLIQWMAREGMAEDLTSPEWIELFGKMTMRELTAAMTDPDRIAALRERFQHVDAILTRFYERFDKQYLYEQGQQRRLLIGPVNTAKDLAENPQLNAREWYQSVEHPELGETIRYPGPPFRLDRSPWRISRRPPLLGEHNLEVWEQELGYHRNQIEALAGAGAL